MYKQIIIAIELDNQDNNDRMIEAAVLHANESQGNIHLLHVVPAAPAIVSQYLDDDYEKMAAREISKSLDEQAQGINLNKGSATSEVRFGTVYQEILSSAEKSSADLVIVGANKPEVSDFLLGTNAARVVRHANCSVFVVR